MIHFVEINDYYLFTVQGWAFWLLAIGLAVPTVGIPWLANRPQPVPDWR